MAANAIRDTSGKHLVTLAPNMPTPMMLEAGLKKSSRSMKSEGARGIIFASREIRTFIKHEVLENRAACASLGRESYV